MQESISEGVKKQPASDSSKYYTANIYMISPPPPVRAHLNSLQNEALLMYISSCNSPRRYQICHDDDQEAIWRCL